MNYILGYKVFIYTNNSSLRHLMNNVVVVGRIILWFFYCMNLYNIYKVKKDNIVVDFLS